jgi:PAS domain S-box-containing protein
MNALRSKGSKHGQPRKRVSWDTKVNSAIAELSRSLLSRASIKDISSLVLRHAKSLTNSELGFVGYIDENSGCLVVPTFFGDIWDVCRIKDKTFVFKDFSGLWGWVLQNGKPLLSNKPSSDRRSSGTPPGHLPIHRFLSVPSLVQGKLVGQISLANSDRNYTKKDLALVDQLASIFADAIHRTRTEKALKESEDLYRTIFETTGTATIIVEEDMAISMVNMECEKLFGYSEEEIVRIRKWDDFIAGEDLDRLREYHCLRRINPDAVPKTYETRVIDRQGSVKDVSITAALIPATKKSIISILDITKHKQAEKALRESEERYRTLIETSPDAIVLMDLNTNILMVNQSALKLFGFESADEISGRNGLDFVSFGDREKTLSDIRQLLETGTLKIVEYSLKKIDGATFPCELKNGLIKDVEGNPKAIITVVRDVTERKRSEEALRKSEEEYRTLIENVNIGIYRSTGGPRGRFLQANPTMIKMFGYDSGEEFLNVPLYELYQDREERKRFVEKIQKQGFVKDEKLRLRKRDGTFIWGSVTAKVQDDANGKIKWIDGAIEDITERKRAEDALFESEGRFRSFFNSVTDSIYVLDKNGTIIQLNIAVVNTLGYTDDELLGSDIAAFFTPDSQEIWREEFPALFKQKFVKFIRMETDVIRKDGSVINVDCTASAVCNEQGDVVNIVVLQKDITKRKRAEERLVQSLEALHSVYNIATTMRGSYETACDQVVYNLSKLLKVSYVSVQYIEEDQVKIISRITEGTFTHNEAASLEHSPCAVVVEKKEPCQMRGPLQQLFPDNELISLQNFKTHIGVPVKSVGGRVAGFICVMDYVDRVFTEDEIRLIEIFARYVAYEHERNIMETQLRQFDRMKLLGQMAAGVAHEVRNPLNAILAITEALFQDIGDNPDYQPFLDHIRTQVDRLSRLMGDLLDLGKPIQSSSLHMEYLPAICAATLDLWQQTPLSQSRRVRLSLPPEQDALNVMADSSKLQQVFLNLLENAAQHSPEGSEIRFVVSTPKKTTARICVIDQGTGVATENLQKVFEPFFTTRKRGNGLGLSIVRNIIQALGGDIMIRNNEIPPGCIVEIILPVVQEGQS